MTSIYIRSKMFSALLGAFTLGIALFTALPATGAQPVTAAVAPFGFAIGQATLREIREGLKDKVSLKNNGTNLYSNGPILETTGSGLDIDGLRRVLFIFDEREILVALQMTLGKGRFDHIYQHLSEKYPLVRRDVPFVGDRYARFQKGNVVIEVSAPHLSFEINVAYMTSGFEQQFETTKREEKAKKRKREAGQF